MKCLKCGKELKDPLGYDLICDCTWKAGGFGTGTKPEPEQDEIMRQFEKCWHGVFDHLDEMLLIEITDVFRSGYKSGYTSRNAEIEALNETHELETKCRDELRRADVDCILRLREENRKQTEEIEALKYQLEGFHDQYNKDEKTIEALKAQIEETKCCGNCGNRKNRICNIKPEIPLGEDVCNYWTRKNNPKNSTPQ